MTPDESLSKTPQAEGGTGGISLGARRPLLFHPKRSAALRETHARPPLELASPCKIARLTLSPPPGQDSLALAERAVRRVCERSGLAVPSMDERQITLVIGRRKVTIERHTEFVTLTIVAGFTADADTALNDSLWSWIADLDGRVVAAIDARVLQSPQPDWERQALASFGTADYAAFRTGHGPLFAASDFTAGADGFVRLLILDDGSSPAFLGRTAQRLLETESYRLAAMLALPEAQALLSNLREKEERLDAIMTKLAAAPHVTSDRGLLIDLSRIAGEVEDLGHRAGYRLGAARAYNQLVLERLDQLHEERVEGHQRFSSFINRRLAPAMRTCEAADRRRAEIAARVSQAIDLLRTRVNVAMEEQSARALRSLDQRSALQLRLQETVEGLSIVAITYYGAGLVHYVAKATTAAGLGLDPSLVTGGAVPIIALVAALSLRRMRRRLRTPDA